MKGRQCPDTSLLYITVLFHAEFLCRILFKIKLLFLLIPVIALILGSSLYFSMPLKTGYFMIFASHRISPLIVTLRFFTTLVKKSLNPSELLPLSEITSFSLTNVSFTESQLY